MTTRIRSRYVMAGGVRTHYSESGGDGETIVALHGGGAGSSGLAGAGSLMEALPDTLRTIALDSVGGFGLTDPKVPYEYGLQSRVDHLEAFLDALCIDRVTLVGNSQGAWAAVKYALLHPERVQRLILIGSATIATALGVPEEHSPGLQVLRGYDGTREGMKTLLEMLAFNHDKITDELIDIRYETARRPGVMEAYKAAVQSNRKLQTDELLRFQFDLRDSLPLLTTKIPTIFIWGNDDKFALPSVGKQVQERLPNVPFFWVDQAGHQVQTDQPEQTAKIIRDFLNW